MMLRILFWRLLFIVVAAGPCGLAAADESAAPPKPHFELRDGDRVVFLGNTLIEREQQYGDWELILTSRWPERNIRFRNLGWDGDTVWAESRGIFDAPEKGYQRLLEHIASLKPTVIFLGYGGNEAFAGQSGLPRFLEQYRKLLGDLQQAAGTQVRFVILSPLAHELQPPPLPAPAANNAKLEHYTAALQALAAERGIPFVDFFHKLPPLPEARRRAGLSYTTNGLHLNEFGYRATAVVMVHELRLVLLEPLAELIAATPASRSTAPDPSETLRQAILAKNELYFHHWRPQNITYLFGFRKHEQGQNAKEVEEFEKLVAEKEAEIARLRGSIVPRNGRN